MSQSILSKLLLWFTAILVGVGLTFLTLAIHRSSFPYNSEGNYFDGVVNYHEQSIIGYGIVAGASFLAAIMMFAIRLLVQRSQQSVPGNRAAYVDSSTKP